jgi:hypothetical protein
MILDRKLTQVWYRETVSRCQRVEMWRKNRCDATTVAIRAIV